MEKDAQRASPQSKGHLRSALRQMDGLLARAKGKLEQGLPSASLQLCEAGHCLHSSNTDLLTESKKERWKGQMSSTYIYSTLYIRLDGIKAKPVENWKSKSSFSLCVSSCFDS